MSRPLLEVADIIRAHGPAWRDANRGGVSLDQLKVMSAIKRCRTAALGGHVARCENAACGYTTIAYNSCRNRHCPKCQAAASRQWLAEREAELPPVPYFHVVYTLPAELSDLAYQSKRLVYGLLMTAAAETTLEFAAWGSAMTHHPRVHMIVPGGGLSEDGARWVGAGSDFLVHVNVLARLFRGKMLAMLAAAYAQGRLLLLGDLAGLANRRAFKRILGPVRRSKWIVYCKTRSATPARLRRMAGRGAPIASG